MKRNGVAAALSALVFPGVGQYYLGRKLRALLFVVVAAASGWIYLSYQIDTATTLADQVLSGSVPLDPAALEARVAAHPAPLRVTLAGIVFVLSWIGSVLEIYLGPRR
jgi:hypothetical protein